MNAIVEGDPGRPEEGPRQGLRQRPDQDPSALNASRRRELAACSVLSLSQLEPPVCRAPRWEERCPLPQELVVGGEDCCQVASMHIPAGDHITLAHVLSNEHLA